VTQLLPPGSVDTSSNISGLSREQSTIEYWFCAPSGQLRGAFFYPPKLFNDDIVSGGLAALGGKATVEISPDGRVLGRGDAHDARAIPYNFTVVMILKPNNSRLKAVTVQHSGHVAGHILGTSGSLDDRWAQWRFCDDVRDDWVAYRDGESQVLISYTSEV
jgi:hypothetical protein